jgi:hypothetical protein
MKSSLFTHKRYKEIVAAAQEFENKISGMKAEKKYDSHYLMGLQNELKTALQTDLKEFYAVRSKEIQEAQEKIKGKYEMDYDKVDIQKELLKRQDFDRKLKISNDDDLKGRVDNFKKTGEGDLVQLEMLQVELKQRGLEESQRVLSAYVDHYGIDKPYAKDEHYQELQSEQQLIRQLGNRDLLYVEQEDGECTPYSPQI